MTHACGWCSATIDPETWHCDHKPDCERDDGQPCNCLACDPDDES